MNLRIWLQGGLLLGAVTVALASSGFLPNLHPFQDSTGHLETFNTTGKVDLTGPFFSESGTNGRSCATCHSRVMPGLSSAAHIAERFEDTHGLDPFFARTMAPIVIIVLTYPPYRAGDMLIAS